MTFAASTNAATAASAMGSPIVKKSRHDTRRHMSNLFAGSVIERRF
ncbi:MAG TPA: hypothetical protein VGY54_10735 [Polyangiaceae bacterium]|jgi:hypothetical protein|nr:hypothetical protein [Polyangiaceae bacterium]